MRRQRIDFTQEIVDRYGKPWEYQGTVAKGEDPITNQYFYQIKNPENPCDIRRVDENGYIFSEKRKDKEKKFITNKHPVKPERLSVAERLDSLGKKVEELIELVKDGNCKLGTMKPIKEEVIPGEQLLFSRQEAQAARTVAKDDGSEVYRKQALKGSNPRGSEVMQGEVTGDRPRPHVRFGHS